MELIYENYFFSSQYYRVLEIHTPITDDLLELERFEYFLGRAEYGLKRYDAASSRFGQLASTGSSKYAIAAQMWVLHVSQIMGERPFIEEAVSRLRSIAAATDDRFIRAVANWTEANIYATAIAAGLMSPFRYRLVAKLIFLAQQEYQASGREREAALCSFERIYFFLRHPLTTTDKAIKEILRTQKRIGQLVPALARKLNALLMKYELIAVAESGSEPDISDFLRKTELLALQADDDFSSAGLDIRYASAALLLDYGYKEGLEIVEKLGQQYFKMQFYAESQTAWNASAQWFRYHGMFRQMELSEAEAAAAGSFVSNRLMMAAELPKILLAHYQRRDIASVVRISSTFLDKTPEQLFAPQIRILRVQALIDSGDNLRAKVELDLIYRSYKKSSPSAYLADAILRYAYFIVPTDLDKALNMLLKAIELQVKLGSKEHEGIFWNHFGQILGFKTDRSYLRGSKVYKTYDVYAKAIQLLSTQPKLTAKIELGKSFQYIGVELLQKGELVESEKNLSAAKNIFIQYNLINELGFVNTHLGNVYQQGARQLKNIDLFRTADQLYAQAAEHFSISGLAEVYLQILGLQGCSKFLQTDYALTAEERELLIIEADLIFQKASIITSHLRSLAGFGEKIAVSAAVFYFNAQHQLAFQLAFIMHANTTKKTEIAISWLEEMKSQSLLNSLQSTSSRRDLPREYRTQLTALAVKKMQEPRPAFRKRIVDKMTAIQEQVHDSYLKKKGITSGADIAIEFTSFLSSYPGQVLTVCYYYTSKELYIFGLRKDWSVPQVHKIPFDINHVDGLQEKTFTNISNKTVSQLKKNISDWAELNYLIEPLESWSEPGNPIYIIPFGKLHHVALHALKTVSGCFLIERNPVSYAPSLQMLKRVIQKAAVACEIHDTAIFGNPTGDLPGAESEAISLSEMLNVKPTIGRLVTKRAFLGAFNTAGLLHYAGHAELNENDGFKQRLILATGKELTAGELLQTPSNLRMLVLSGCSTGLSQLIVSGDETVGFIYAAFLAGVETVVASRWKVLDTSSSQFFQLFYSNLLKGEPANYALRSAVLTMILNGSSIYDWAAFAVNGNGFLKFPMSTSH